MATFKQGINGPFNGKVGSVVGYQWKGISVMRGLPRFTKPRTVKQLANQAKMALMLYFLKIIIVIVRKGFYIVGEERQMSAFNVAMSYNKKHAIKGEYPDFEIDYSKVMIAQGELEGPVNPRVQQIGEAIEFSWDPEVNTNGQGNDQAMLLIVGYKPEAIAITPMSGSGNRRDRGKEIINVGKSFKGATFATYIAFISDDRKKASDSMYCGDIEFQ